MFRQMALVFLTRKIKQNYFMAQVFQFKFNENILDFQRKIRWKFRKCECELCEFSSWLFDGF